MGERCRGDAVPPRLPAARGELHDELAQPAWWNHPSPQSADDIEGCVGAMARPPSWRPLRTQVDRFRVGRVQPLVLLNGLLVGHGRYVVADSSRQDRSQLFPVL